MTTHPDPEQLSAYIDGELTGTGRDDLEQHLTGCSECSATLRGLRATVADMRALPSPVPSEQDSWALRSAIAKARRKPAERYRRWVVAAGSAAAVAAAIVGVVSLSHNTQKETFGSTSSEVNSNRALAPLNSGSAEIQFDSTNYNSSSAKQLLAPVAIAAPAVNGPRTTKGSAGQTFGPTSSTASLADQTKYRSEILACEREIFSHGAGGARAQTYIVGRYDGTAAFFLIYSVVVSGKTKREMWVVQQSDCYIRLFVAPQ